MLLWELFITFFMIGFVSFGGGYAMIPLIQEEVVYRHGWMTAQQFTDVIAVAGMSPGPIAANSAVFIGYSQAGIFGAIVSAAGMVLPSLIIILIIGMIFYKVQQNKTIKSAFYSLRAVITGLIIYAALSFASNNGLIGTISAQSVTMAGIFIASLTALMVFRIHPVVVIVLSGVFGAAIFS